MDRNVKIALGCGGAGCLGLIVVMVAGVAIYLLWGPTNRSSTNRNSNFNYNSNRNSNAGSTSSNDNSTSNENDSSSSTSSISEDDKHKLFHAASITRDSELIRRVGRKIGILKDDYSPSDNNVEFATEHVGWVFRNTDFIQSMDTPAKAREYVNQHIND